MRKLGRIIKGILLFISFFGVILLRLLYMDTLMLEKLVLQDSEQITEEFFIEKTEITMNQNIMQYNLFEKERDIEEHPYIQQASIRRKFPDSLEIKLKERQEYAIIPYNGKYLFVDRDLYLLRKSEGYFSGTLPVLRGIQVNRIDLGEQISTDSNELLLFAFDAYEALKISDIYPDITEYYLVEDRLVIETSEHIDIVLGKDTDLAYTVVASQQVYQDLLNRNQRNATIVSKYKDYIHVETGTFHEGQGSNEEDAESVPESLEEQEESSEDD